MAQSEDHRRERIEKELGNRAGAHLVRGHAFENGFTLEKCTSSRTSIRVSRADQRNRRLEMDLDDRRLAELDAQRCACSSARVFRQELAYLFNASEAEVRARGIASESAGVQGSIPAAEFATRTAYMYSPTGGMRGLATQRKKVMCCAAEPHRTGIEFDYCCVHGARAARRRIETIMVNCNPETFRRLRYFRPAISKRLRSKMSGDRDKERPYGVIVQSRQTP